MTPPAAVIAAGTTGGRRAATAWLDRCFPADAPLSDKAHIAVDRGALVTTGFLDEIILTLVRDRGAAVVFHTDGDPHHWRTIEFLAEERRVTDRVTVLDRRNTTDDPTPPTTTGEP